MEIVFTPLFRETYERVAEPDRVVDSATQLHGLGVTNAVTQFAGQEPAAIIGHMPSTRRVIPALAELQ